jgi:PAT family acetyl-CoA transporter-like MFS transporter 1
MISQSDKRGIFVLTILYFIQGLPIGFYSSTIPLLLIENGASFSQLAMLSLVFYPFSFKIFFAPIEDYYFNSKFGKRKTYIVPIQILLAITYIISG